MSEKISYSSFRRQFPDGTIRTLLDLPKLEEGMEDGVIHISAELTSTWDTTTLYAPWYKDGKGRPVSYDEPGARPWRYDDLIGQSMVEAPDFPYPGESSPATERIFKDAKILSLDVGPDKHLVLDGNHRLVLRLGFLASKQIVLPHYRIHAPLDPPLVPDVRHFT